MYPKYDKLTLGRTLNDIAGGTDCHHYGSVSGCDENCPALLFGGCYIPDEVIEKLNIDDDEKLLLYKLYEA